MALGDEHADILGGPIMQRPKSGFFPAFAQYHFALKSLTCLVLGLLLWIACVRGLEHLKRHRELRCKKAMRRKHGIPDSDCRPFAVAYAAAKRAHLEREAQDRKKITNYVSDHNLPAVGQRTDPRKDARGLRKRVPGSTVQLYDYQFPAKHTAPYDNRHAEVDVLSFADRYNPNTRPRLTVPQPPSSSTVRRTSRKALAIGLDDNEESKKRSHEDEGDVEPEAMKKSRIEGDELIDGDEQANWYGYSDKPPRRVLNEPPEWPMEDNDVHIGDQCEQVDDHRHKDYGLVDEAMEGIDERVLPKPRSMARGKKRDRAEAGSTFGGDDDEDIRNGRASHYRNKRRTTSRRMIEVPTRGQKRDREAESPESGGDGGDSETSRRRAQRGSQKKRGRKAVSDDAKEVLIEDPNISKDPLCGGRKVGDEWEDEGVQYKVGDKGERLRLTLVKKARNKYHMPQDSQHPDRSAALEIYVETWMTEELYKQAEGRQELAWQEITREPSGTKTPDIFDSPTKSGKSLLWDSVRGGPARRHLGQFMVAGSSACINPFKQSHLHPTLGRRVASSNTIVSPILPGVSTSSTRPGFRGFSKWEKQDREAEAMARIRAKIEEQKKAQLLPQKTAEIPISATAPELTAKPLSVPTITLTPAPTAVTDGGLDEGASQSKANIATPSPAPFNTTDPKGNNVGTAPANTPTISLSSTSASSTPNTFPSAPAAPTVSSSSPSPFSFAQLPQLPTLSSPSTVPNFFEKPTGTSVSSSSTSTLATTHVQPESAPKSIPFSFAKPSSLSSTPVSSVPVAPILKSQPSLFGATSSSSLSSVTFGSTPVAKVDSSAPLAAAGSESSKPMVPLFSFSGLSPSPSATTLPTSSAPSSTPKFSFGQSAMAPTSTPTSNLTQGTSLQPKPTFKFGQTSSGTVDPFSVVPTADEPKKSTVPVSVFGTAGGLNEPTKPSSSGTADTLASSTIITPSLPTMNLSGKSTNGSSAALASSLPKPSQATMAFNSAFSSTPAQAPASASTFSLGAVPGSNTTEDPKLTSVFGGPAQSSKPTSLFGGNAESKPVLGGGPNITFSLGNSGASKTAPTFGSVANAATPRLDAESTKSDGLKVPNAADAPKPAYSMGNIFGPSPSAPFTFGRSDATINPSTTTTQARPETSFAFIAPSSATGSTFAQPSVFVTNGDSNQVTLGKPHNATSSVVGLGTGVSGASGAFTFGKPAAQNQKQEQ